MRFKRILIGITAVTALTGLAACSSGSSSSGSGSSSTTSMAAPTTGSATDTAQFGAACGQVPASGAGSFSGMAQAPVATAASNNPILSTLVTAVKKANLVDTLNSQSGITVFAPDNDAFAKIPAATLNGVLANNTELTKILTYHVVAGRITPAQLASGNFKTLEGGTVTSTGTGQDYTINGSAHVVCGNVQTANATVYIIDSVLMPPSS